MKLHRVVAIARKEVIHVIRDPRSLGLAVAIPMVLLLLFGFALTLDVDRVPLSVWDRSGTPESRDFVARFEGSRFFDVRARAASYAEIERAIDLREVVLALVIPEDFARRVETAPRAPVQLIADGSDSNTATIALGYAEAVALDASRDVVLRRALRAEGRASEPPVDLRARVWFNPDLQSRNYIIPGLIAVIMMVTSALLTSLTIAREWERGTMEQLIATPVRAHELILGKLIPYFAIGLLDVLLAVVMGEFVFRVPLRGSAGLLFALSGIFLAAGLSLGVMISIVARTQLLASQLAMLVTFLPAFLLSGFMFAIPSMPPPIQLLTRVLPARYFVAILKGIYLKGVGLRIVGAEAALLGLFAAAVLTLACLRFKKKLG